MTTRKSKTTTRDGQTALVPMQQIERSILVLRGQRVMLDVDLAALYGVETRELIQAVKRNSGRFPSDFMFQLTAEEFQVLRSQFVISKPEGRGGRRYPPYAFTEHGAIMAANLTNSEHAIQVSVLVVRAFVRLRQFLLSHKELARKIEALERQFTTKTKEHEDHIVRIYKLIDSMGKTEGHAGNKRIGFVCPRKDSKR